MLRVDCTRIILMAVAQLSLNPEPLRLVCWDSVSILVVANLGLLPLPRPDSGDQAKLRQPEDRPQESTIESPTAFGTSPST